MKDKLTIIYYTASTEDEYFENAMIENIRKQAGDIPMISISRKLMTNPLGPNIVVGEQPICYSNSFRQLLIGLEQARTEFCIAAESDVLYPPEYFQFIPPRNDKVHRYMNMYVYFDGYGKFWRKKSVEGAQMCGREYWIKNIKRVLNGSTDWNPIKVNPPFVFEDKNPGEWTGDTPVLYFKTRKGIGFKTGFMQGTSVKELPYWGTVNTIKSRVGIK